MRVDDQGAIKAQQQGVAIGLCGGHQLGANVARCSGTVVYHHLLPQALGQLLGNQAPTGVGDAFRGKRHDQSNRFEPVGNLRCKQSRLNEGFAADARLKGISADEVMTQAVARIPLGRMAEPAEIANAVVLLASSKASYITGICMSMDGALHPVVV